MTVDFKDEMNDVVIMKTNEFYIVKCGYCKGSGQNYLLPPVCIGDRRNPCPICKGSGYLKLIIPSEWDQSAVGILKCSFCIGSGKMYPYVHVKNPSGGLFCPVCAGAGVSVGLYPRVPCSLCDESGLACPHLKYLLDPYREQICHSCSGVGSIWINNIRYG